VLPEIFGEKAAEYGKEQHQKFPEVVSEFFSFCMWMMVDFHKYLSQVVFVL